MKNFRPIPTLLAAVLIATVAIFYACSKQESTLNPVNEQELSPRDLAINNTIKSFRDKVSYLHENPGYKSGESYTADSALWLLEATINYSHTFPNDYYGQLITDTLYLTLATNDAGEVDMNELAVKYDAMKTAISAVYHSKAIAEKGLVLVNLEDVSFKSDEVVIEVVAITGERTEGTPPEFGNSGPFQDFEDYWYGEYFGQCFPHTYDTDAAQLLKAAMNNYIPDLSSGYFYCNLTVIRKKGGDPNLRRLGDPKPQDNIYDYYLYNASDTYDSVTNENLCLTPNELNTYFYLLEHLLFNKIPSEDVPAAYEIVRVIWMNGDYDKIENDLLIHYYHEGDFEYGLKCCRASGEIAIEI
jgi:hypothetical protein